MSCSSYPHPFLTILIWTHPLHEVGGTSSSSDRSQALPSLLGIVMSLHKLSAGRGYDYLVQQVAALDATHRGSSDLASYYAERGETPGRWMGGGIAGVDGLEVGDVVTGEQMRLLFAEGRHPLAGQAPPGADGRELLGVPFRSVEGVERPFRRELRDRYADQAESLGLSRRAGLPAEVRARIRTDLALEWFRDAEGREPKGDLELTSAVARWSRPAPAPVGGYDLTFSPVKSVSALWALAPPDVAARIEAAHQAAVAEALVWLEDHALFSREGTAGVRQVNVTGLVAAAFTHRDSRAGDPDLHTHVAVANKVQTLQGRWLSIDGRVLHAAATAASEAYNTALETRLTCQLGLRFVDRPGRDRSKRPVREIVGLDPALLACWSSRRRVIEVRAGELAAAFTAEHGRAPGRVEQIQLAQQATLETRDPKHEPRRLAEQRATWHTQAVEVMGGPSAVAAMVSRALRPMPVAGPVVTGDWIGVVAERVISVLEEHRAIWQPWHVWAETQRQLRDTNLSLADLPAVAKLVVDASLARSVRLTTVEDPVGMPVELRRLDGASVFTVAGAEQYTSLRILAAEQRLLDAANQTGGYALNATAIDLGLMEAAANGLNLDDGQATMVQTLAVDRRGVLLVIAPAGAGKTTALKVLADTWIGGGGHILGLAPSATAAHQLQQATGMPADTLARLSWALDHDRPVPEWARAIGPKTLLVVDEAGMADTPTLDTVIRYVLGRGGRVCLVGDDRQLGAVGPSGILTDLHAAHGALRLTQLHRFSDPAEADATLQIRNGHPDGLAYYADRDRIHTGDHAVLSQRLMTAWQIDRNAGLDTLMLAPSRRQVADLNRQARALLREPHPPGREVTLADGNQAGVGDVIITRRNDRRLATGHSWVRNGDRWTITGLSDDGTIHARHLRTGTPITLPNGYIAGAVQLGYATTVHAAQGVTVDTTHGLVDELMTREQLYTMLSRGRHANHLYVPGAGPADLDHHGIIQNGVHEQTADETLHRILIRSDLAVSATTTRAHQRQAAGPDRASRRPAPRYDYPSGPAPTPGPPAPGW